MKELRTRYPGAQPFDDDEFSRRLFFGRDKASVALTDQILANRLVVVYAKSGLGKTSLLRAGVAPRLRDDAHLPLFVRVNDVERGALASTYDGIQSEAERQGVECVAGVADSLWSFFKTAEFWQGDLLLTPVLVLDQFEELFTLQKEEAREAFLKELGYLIRGVPPSPLPEADHVLGGEPPQVRIVLSLREDFLALLEDASDHIPQILDHRFRLSPLSFEAAADAMRGPASLDDSALQTRPFRLDEDAMTDILDYLSKRRTKAIAQTTRYVEPFHLQLVCRRIEEMVAARQRASSADIVIGMKDIGGKAGISETLKNFYTNAVSSLQSYPARRGARRLCEQFLISPEGRRLSLEETEIGRQLGLRPETLRVLARARLLRSENRADSTYYELSHDALIAPVLAARKRKALLFSWLGLGLAVAGLGLITMLIIITVAYLGDAELNSNMAVVLSIPLMMTIGSTISLFILYAKNIRVLRRYRGRMPDEPSFPTKRPSLVRGVMYGACFTLVGLYIIIGFFAVLLVFVQIIVEASTGHPYLGNLMQGDAYFVQFQKSMSERGIGLDTIVTIVSLPLGLLFGIRLLRWGSRCLLQLPLRLHSHRREASSGSSASAWATFVGASIMLLAAITAAATDLLTNAGCAYLLEGRLPSWLMRAPLNFLRHDCQARYWVGVDFSDVLFFSLPTSIAVVAEASILWAGRRRNVRRLFAQPPHAGLAARTG